MKNLLFALALMLSLGLAAAEPEAPEAPEGVEPAEVAQPAEPVTLSTFYESLTPHGTWVLDKELGWVWQPREVAVDVEWRPYCQGGHWVWTNCGWYWESNYKWGWAPFHYGRWSRHATLHWIWVPDCTWGPAWVNWRECDTHLGWAPLPPGCVFEVGVGFSYHRKHVDFGFDFGLVDVDFTFVPCHTFLEINLWKHHCGHRDVVRIYNKTVIRNTYIVHNKTIINSGCAKVVVEKHCHTKLNEVRVYSGHRRSEHRTKNGIATYRPHVKNSAPHDPKHLPPHKAAPRKPQQRQHVPAPRQTPPKQHVRPQHQAPAPRQHAPAQPRHQAPAPQHHPAPAPHQKQHHK